MAVVSIVGPYHSGKSFMLNQLVRALADYTVAGEPNPGYVRADACSMHAPNGSEGEPSR